MRLIGNEGGAGGGGSPCNEPLPFPRSWQEAVMLLSNEALATAKAQQQAFDRVADELRAKHAGDLAELRQQVVDLQSLVKQQGEAAVKAGEARAEIGERLGEVADQVGKAARGLAKLGETVDADGAKITELTDQVDGQRQRADSIAEQLAELNDQVKTGFEAAGKDAAASATEIATDIAGVRRAAADAAARAGEVGERVDGVALALDGHVKAVGELRQVVDQVADLPKAHGALVQEVASVHERLDAVDENLKTSAELVQSIEETVTTKAKALDELTGAVDVLRTDGIGGTDRALDDLRSQVKQLTDARVTMTDQISETFQGVQKYAGDCFNQSMEAISAIEESLAATDRAVSETLSELGQSVRTIQQQVDKNGTQAAEALDVISNAINDRIDTVVKEVGTVVTDSRSALDAARTSLHETREHLHNMPRTLIMNRQGDLVAVTGAGEERDLGRVVGRDGTDAASVVSMKTEGKTLVLVRGDGQEIKCALPAAPAPAEKAVQPAPALDIKDMVAMKRAGEPLAVIGQRHGISGSYAGRLIKQELKRQKEQQK